MSSFQRGLLLTVIGIALNGCSHGRKVESPQETSTASKPPSGEFEVIPFFGDTQVYRARLDNGLKVLIVQDPSSPTFSYQTWFDVGSRNERQQYTGLAHLFEHMMFKRTSKHPEGEFDRLLERAGVEGENAFTSNDYTAYVQELPKSQLELIIELESDRMVNLVVDEAALKTEIEVVQNERRMRNENSPEGLIWQNLFETVFTIHPYHWPVIGYEEDLNRVTPSVAMDFYKTYYSPNRAVVVVVGDVEPDSVLSLIRKHYGKIQAQPELAENIPMEPAQTEVRRKTLKLNTPVEKLAVAFRIPGLLHEDTPALQLIQALLTDGKGARLKRALIDTGIASGVSSGNFENKDASMYVFQVNLQKGKKARFAETILLNEIQKLIRQPVGRAELDRALNLVQFAFYEGLMNDSGKSTFLGHYEIVGRDFTKGLAMYRSLKEVTPETLQRVARTYFNPNARTVIQGVPK